MGPRNEQQIRETVTGRVNNSTLFHTPLYAMRQDANGNIESVRLLGTGDVEGHSPCYLFVGDDGVSAWDSQAKFTIIDPTCLPASREALATLGKTLMTATGGSNSGDARR